MSGIIAQNTLDNSGLIKSPAGGGAWNFISKQTASSSATIDFTSGIDSTYREYFFTFKNIHPENDEVGFDFQGNAAGGADYNETMTTTHFSAYHNEAGSEQALTYQTTRDQAQGTAFQKLTNNIGNGNDECTSGYLHLFNPSSTVFVTHFIAHFVDYHYQDYILDIYTTGYFNTTSAIDEIQFKMSSGAIDAGDICLYGITT